MTLALLAAAGCGGDGRRERPAMRLVAGTVFRPMLSRTPGGS